MLIIKKFLIGIYRKFLETEKRQIIRKAQELLEQTPDGDDGEFKDKLRNLLIKVNTRSKTFQQAYLRRIKKFSSYGKLQEINPKIPALNTESVQRTKKRVDGKLKKKKVYC